MGSTNVEAPPPRDIAQEGQDTLQSQINLAPQQFSATSQYAPQYAQLYQNILGQNAPQLQQLQGQLNTQQRTSDIQDVANLGPQALAAYRAANPGLSSIQDAFTQRALSAQNPVSMLGDPTAVNAQTVTAGDNYGTRAVLDSTLSELAKGGSLSQQETLANQDATLNRFNQLGRATDPSAIAGTALGLDSAQQARLAQRQTAAGAASSLYEQQLGRQLSADQGNQNTNLNAQEFNTNAQYQTGVANQGAQLNNANYINSLLSQAGQFNAATAQDPFNLVLGRSNAAQQAAAGTSYNGNNEFDPFSAYASDLNNTNYNAQAAANIATANNNAGLWSGGLQAIGSLGGAAIGAAGLAAFCWVAREVYGAENPRWLAFRDWMLTQAPAALRENYKENGARLAELIRFRPEIKTNLREFMDQIIEEEMTYAL